MPRRTEIAKREFEEARYRAVATTLSLTVDVRRAYVRAIAAQQKLALLEQARQTADASAQMMRQLGETGAAVAGDDRHPQVVRDPPRGNWIVCGQGRFGRLLVDAIFARDYPVIQGCMLFVAFTYVLVNLVIDLCYPIFDPRVMAE